MENSTYAHPSSTRLMAEVPGLDSQIPRQDLYNPTACSHPLSPTPQPAPSRAGDGQRPAGVGERQADAPWAITLSFGLRRFQGWEGLNECDAGRSWRVRVRGDGSTAAASWRERRRSPKH